MTDRPTAPNLKRSLIALQPIQDVRWMRAGREIPPRPSSACAGAIWLAFGILLGLGGVVIARLIGWF